MKSCRIFLLLFAMLFLLAACVSIPLGDGQKIKISKDEVTFVDEEGKEQKVEVDESNEEVHITGTDSDGKETNIAIGSDLELPANLPQNIPIPEDAVVYQSNEMNNLITVVLQTEMEVEVLEEMYDDYIREASPSNEYGMEIFEQEDGFYAKSYYAELDQASIQIQLMVDEKIDILINFEDKSETITID